MSEMLRYISGMLACLAMGISGTNMIWIYSNKVIPSQDKVQSGYVVPSKLEIVCKDLDGNGEPETIMKISDKQYLLREIDGIPVISAYKIKPVEVVPNKE